MEQRSIGGIKYEHPQQGYEYVLGGWSASGDLPELVVGEITKYPSPGVWFETGVFEEVACDVLLIVFARKDLVKNNVTVDLFQYFRQNGYLVR